MTERDPPSEPRMDTSGQDKATRPDLAADMQGFARDWITGWQSELAASAVDRELAAGLAPFGPDAWRREQLEPPVLWREGDTRLLDFGGEGNTLLFVPSLINRATVLDLTGERSMMRYLAANGARVLLLDWGWPGEVERSFSLTDYIAGRLERALLAAGQQVLLVGYCMGGLLAVAAAQRRPDLSPAPPFLATPWDFQAGHPDRAAHLARLTPLFEPAMKFRGTLPVDAL